jgi:hypothetical protein
VPRIAHGFGAAVAALGRPVAAGSLAAAAVVGLLLTVRAPGPPSVPAG